MSDIQYLTTILEGIVSDPDSIKINRSVDEMGVLLSVYLAKEDMGKVIGRKGLTINAIRHIMKCFGYGIDAELNIKIVEPDNYSSNL